MDNIQEIWKPIPGHEGYEASNIGRIKRLTRIKPKRRLPVPEAIKKLTITSHGYFSATIQIGTYLKPTGVHRLVAKAFIPNPENKPQVNHINCIKTDNRVENLEWCTQSENAIHAEKNGLINHPKGLDNVHSRLTPVSILVIREAVAAKYNARAIGRYFKINRNTVYAIYRRKAWKHIP